MKERSVLQVPCCQVKSGLRGSASSHALAADFDQFDFRELKTAYEGIVASGVWLFGISRCCCKVHLRAINRWHRSPQCHAQSTTMTNCRGFIEQFSVK
jgi:hypothetical protein